jgi:hypothetical protein
VVVVSLGLQQAIRDNQSDVDDGLHHEMKKAPADKRRGDILSDAIPITIATLLIRAHDPNWFHR